MRIEILVASPPTSKCQCIINFIEKLEKKYPDRLKIDIYLAGMQLTIKPTRGYQVKGKQKRVPGLFINGFCVANGDMPDFDKTEEIIKRELGKDPQFWQ